MNIEKLTKVELIELRNQIDSKLNKIEQDDINETDIKNMTSKTKLTLN